MNARLAEWEELEALRDIKVRVVWQTRQNREQVLAAFAVITPAGEKLLGDDYLEAFPLLARRP